MSALSASPGGDPAPLEKEEAEALTVRLRRAHATLVAIPADRLESVWNDAVSALADRRSEEGRTLREALRPRVGLSEEGLEAGLAVLLAGVSPQVARELFRRARPRSRPDLLLVILAATPPLLAVQPLLPCLARRRPTLLKSSSREPAGAPALLDALSAREPALDAAFAAVSWSAGAPVEEAVAARVDRIVVFGGREAAERFASRWPERTTVQGPRTSVAVIAAQALPEEDRGRLELFDRLAEDVALFDQRGCLSLQLVLTDAPPETVAEPLLLALERAARRLPPGALEPEVAARVQARRAEAVMAGERCLTLEPARGTVIVSAAGRPLEPSPGARTVTVRPVSELGTLPAVLAPWRGRLQGAVLIGEGASALEPSLRALGVAHFAPPGRLQWVDALWPNGGHDPLELY